MKSENSNEAQKPAMEKAISTTEIECYPLQNSYAAAALREIAWMREDASNITFHGIRHVVEDRPAHRRIMWALLWMSSMSVFLWLFAVVMLDYINSPFNTINPAYPQSSLIFPAITICNINSLDVSRVSYAKELRDIIASAAFDTNTPSLNVSPNHQRVFNMSAKTVLDATTPPFNDMFRVCEYDEETRNCSESFYVRYWGMTRCYTLDLTKLEPATYRTSLRVIININQNGYVVHRDKAAGVKFYLHHPSDEPNVEMPHGTVASPGFSTHISMNVQHFKFLPSPYKSMGDRFCVDTTAPDFLKNYDAPEYQANFCFMHRVMEKTMTHCNCSTPYSTKITTSTLPVCTVYQMYFCVMSRIRDFYEDIITAAENLGCPQPCDYTTYKTSVTFSYFPSDVGSYELQRRSVISQNASEIRSNYLQLLFYYDSLIIHETLHTEVYSVTGLLGTIGGNAGIFLGASFLSCCEATSIFVSAFILLYRRIVVKIQYWRLQRAKEPCPQGISNLAFEAGGSLAA